MPAPEDAQPEANFRAELGTAPDPSSLTPGQAIEQHPYMTLAFPLTAAGLLALRSSNWKLGALGGAACFAGTMAVVTMPGADGGSAKSLKGASLPAFIAARPLDAAIGFFFGAGISTALLLVFDDMVFMIIPRSWLKVLGFGGGVFGVAAFWYIVCEWAAGRDWGDSAPNNFTEWFENLVLLSPVPGLILQELTDGTIDWGDWVKGIALNNPPVALAHILYKKACTIV